MAERLKFFSSEMALELVPQCGGKILSLRRVHPCHEFIAPPMTRSPRAPEPGRYTPEDAWGFEDVFPSRQACQYPVHPYRKVIIGEQGDVWSRPWRFRQKDQVLRLWTADKRFGYKLEKRLTFPANDTLRLDYRLDNIADDEFRYLWAGRLRLALTEKARLQLPDGSRLCRTDSSPADGPAAGKMELNGEVRLDPGRHPAGSMARWMNVDPLATGRVDWIDTGAAARLTLRWAADQIPHLAVAVNRGGWPPGGSLQQVELEPRNSPLDSLADPRQELVGVVPPLQSREWWLEIQVGVV